MKRIIAASIVIILFSCNNAPNGDNKVNSNTDNKDTTIHPNGVNEGAVISTDTGAYKINDSAKQNHNSKQ